MYALRSVPARAKIAMLSTLLAASQVWAGGREASFRGLGDLPGGSFRSGASGVSGDGPTVCGSGIDETGDRATRWTIAEGMVPIGFERSHRANATSLDGSVIVGVTWHGQNSQNIGFVWTLDGGTLEIGPEGVVPSGISGDGRVVVGGGPGNGGFRWTRADGLRPLPCTNACTARDASRDGSVIVGNHLRGGGGNFAFLWTEWTGIVELGEGYARAVSCDGSVVVGERPSVDGTEAFRWSEDGGMTGLGFLPGSVDVSRATDVSCEGLVVVGFAQGEGGQAFVWDPYNGMRGLRTILTRYGVGTSGWQLRGAASVSEGGIVIVGNGINPDGRLEAWLATLPDCNANAVVDFIDIGSGTSPDCNGNGIPDECERMYVDADAVGAECGVTWADAVTDLQRPLSILEEAGIGGEVWVAEGTYTPDRDTGDREATFRLLPGVAIYGGFSGSERERRQRDPRRHPTVLSGDLDGDDGPDFTNREDNAYHVLTADDTDATAILDGVVIRGGHATFGGGGGIHNENGSPIIRNCTLRDNFAPTGGAMHNDFGAAPTMVNCRFLDNAARNEGGALYNFAAEPTIESSEFIGNSATSDGGAMFNDLSTVTLRGSTLFANTSHSRGGGIYNYVAVEARVTSTIFWSNTDGQGGGESAQIFNNPSNIVAINYSIVDGWTGDFGGEGNSGDDPRFVDANAGNLRLSSDSPAIGAGDPSVTLEPGVRDLDGHARVLCGRVDIGAYEFGLGDHNCDRTVTLDDYRAWGDCMTGPDAGPYGDGCEAFDFEFDGDVDVRDYTAWQVIRE